MDALRKSLDSIGASKKKPEREARTARAATGQKRSRTA
jgi:hypothetical protein